MVVGARLRLTPDHLRGRVISAARLISGSLLALGPLVAGLLVQGLGTTDTLLLLAGWQLLVALTATATKALRTGIALPAYPDIELATEGGPEIVRPGNGDR